MVLGERLKCNQIFSEGEVIVNGHDCVRITRILRYNGLFEYSIYSIFSIIKKNSFWHISILSSILWSEINTEYFIADIMHTDKITEAYILFSEVGNIGTRAPYCQIIWHRQMTLSSWQAAQKMIKFTALDKKDFGKPISNILEI